MSVERIDRWSSEQRTVLEQAEQGKNILMMGPGGTGKSTVIREIHRRLTMRHRTVQVCALTGCAALLLRCRARTVHSFAGIGLGRGSITEILARLLKNPYRVKLWKSVDVLIVDEISMMSKKLFDTLDQIGRRVRKTPHRAFGGIQLIFSGDFYQLAPVESPDDPDTGRFCFESERFMSTWDTTVELRTIFRQQADRVFGDLLNRVRVGVVIEEDAQLLESRVGRTVAPEDVQPTRLVPKRVQADTINRQNLAHLPEPSVAFEAEIHTNLPITDTDLRGRRQGITAKAIEMEVEALRNQIPCESTIHLRIGAQVMCVVNLEAHGLCNGSQGVVQGFTTDSPVRPIIRFRNGAEIPMMPYIWASEHVPGVGISQIPLILAWGLTIHKAQGATLDCAEIDAGGSIFDFGQTYVALSRVRTIDGLYLQSFDAKRIHAHPKVVEFYESVRKKQT